MRVEVGSGWEALLVIVENTRIWNLKGVSSFGEGWHTRICNLRDRWLAQGLLSAAWAHYVRDIAAAGMAEFVYCPTEEMIADIFTMLKVKEVRLARDWGLFCRKVPYFRRYLSYRPQNTPFRSRLVGFRPLSKMHFLQHFATASISCTFSTLAICRYRH